MTLELGPDGAMRELADSGSLCDSCGGVHISTVDAGIVAHTTATNTGVRLPWCDCDDCPICKDFRAALARFIRASEADNSHIDAMNAESHATVPASQEIGDVPRYEALGALRQEITAIQRELEGFGPRLLDARLHPERNDWHQLFREREELKDRLAALQASL